MQMISEACLLMAYERKMIPFLVQKVSYLDLCDVVSDLGSNWFHAKFKGEIAS